MKNFKIDSRKFIVYGVLLVVFFLLMGLSTRFADLNELNDQNDMMNTEVSVLRATNDTLATQITFATSETAVDQYAREKGHMVKPGEILVIPVSPKKITPTPKFVPTATV